MSSNLLQKAQNYEKVYGSKIKDEERPLFHITPYIGWMNDPNGFSYYNGQYHLFYQYNPYTTFWSSMHWGHMVSDDMINWKRLPAIMAPDQKYDDFGVFSGSALVTKDGKHLLIYTGVESLTNDDGYMEQRQTQCLAFGDGLNYEKYEGNPVIVPEMLPEGSSTVDFRDPKIWWDEEEKFYYVVCGSRTSDGTGAIVLFRSPDAKKWEYVSTLDRSNDQYGKMWECPDFFYLDGTDIIITSPQEMVARGLEFHNGDNSMYITGSYDPADHTFQRMEIRSIDYGLDFYAPQTMVTPDGRRVLVGWMQSPESGHNQPHGIKWFGQLTIPRELHVKDGRLIQNPVRELEKYQSVPVVYRDVYVRERMSLANVKGRTIDMTVNIRPAGGTVYDTFTIKLAKGTEFYTALVYDSKNSVLKLDRSHSGFRCNIVTSRKASVRYQGGEIKLRVILDRFSIEVFVNDGEQVMSATLYTPQDNADISFEAVGSAIIDVEKYDIVLNS